MPQRLQIPKFATEAEEAQWWFDNQDLLDAEFALADREGRLHVRINGERRPLPPRLELNEADWSKARTLAQERGVALGAYVSSLVHEALLAEEARSA